MKRPLCLLAILVTVAAFFLNVFKYSSVIAENGPSDKSYIELVGKVHNKELKKDLSGNDISVIYLIPTGQENRDFEMVQCYLDPSMSLAPSIGEYVRVCGKVKTFSRPTNPGEFDSYLYYSTLKISYRLTGTTILETGGKKSLYKESLYQVKIFFERALDKILSEKDSSIMKAMLLGDRAFIDEETKDMYKNSGIMHTLAVSGLHISILGMGLYRLLKALMEALFGFVRLKLPGEKRTMLSGVFWKGLPTGIAILVMYSYGIMCGMGSSSFRAICMFIIRLLAPMAGRTYDVLSALSVAAILLLLDQPLYLYNSGFLFSFGAVVGLMVIKPALRPMGHYTADKIKFVDDRENDTLISFIKDYVLKTIDALCTGLAIMLATLPVYAMFYYTYPVHSILLNLLVIPLMTILMLAGILAMLLGAILPFLGYVPGFLVHVILYFYKVISSFETVNGSFTWYMGHSDSYQVVLYLALIVGFLAFSNLFSGDKDIKVAGTLLKLSPKKLDALRLFILVTGIVVLTFRNDPELEINMIDVGQGDGIVISCEEKHLLIDGGSTSKKNVGKYQIIPFLKYKGIGKLDAVVLTHEDLDHLSGILEIMDDMEKGGIKILKVILPEVSESSRGEAYHRLENRAKELSIPVLYINKGEEFDLGSAHFTCLNPEADMSTRSANAYSTVLYMEYQRNAVLRKSGARVFKALFTGDVEENGQECLKRVLLMNPEKYKDINILKVAHHGSQYTTDEEFLKITDPDVALISCGKDNSYGHPHKELIDRLKQYGAEIYRTDTGGEINVTIDNDKIILKQYLEE